MKREKNINKEDGGKVRKLKLESVKSYKMGKNKAKGCSEE